MNQNEQNTALLNLFREPDNQKILDRLRNEYNIQNNLSMEDIKNIKQTLDEAKDPEKSEFFQAVQLLSTMIDQAKTSPTILNQSVLPLAEITEQVFLDLMETLPESADGKISLLFQKERDVSKCTFWSFEHKNTVSSHFDSIIETNPFRIVQLYTVPNDKEAYICVDIEEVTYRDRITAMIKLNTDVLKHLFFTYIPKDISDYLLEYRKDYERLLNFIDRPEGIFDFLSIPQPRIYESDKQFITSLGKKLSKYDVSRIHRYQNKSTQVHWLWSTFNYLKSFFAIPELKFGVWLIFIKVMRQTVCFIGVLYVIGNLMSSFKKKLDVSSKSDQPRELSSMYLKSVLHIFFVRIVCDLILSLYKYIEPYVQDQIGLVEYAFDLLLKVFEEEENKPPNLVTRLLKHLKYLLIKYKKNLFHILVIVGFNFLIGKTTYLINPEAQDVMRSVNLITETCLYAILGVFIYHEDPDVGKIKYTAKVDGEERPFDSSGVILNLNKFYNFVLSCFGYKRIHNASIMQKTALTVKSFFLSFRFINDIFVDILSDMSNIQTFKSVITNEKERSAIPFRSCFGDYLNYWASGMAFSEILIAEQKSVQQEVLTTHFSNLSRQELSSLIASESKKSPSKWSENFKELALYISLNGIENHNGHVPLPVLQNDKPLFIDTNKQKEITDMMDKNINIKIQENEKFENVSDVFVHIQNIDRKNILIITMSIDIEEVEILNYYDIIKKPIVELLESNSQQTDWNIKNILRYYLVHQYKNKKVIFEAKGLASNSIELIFLHIFARSGDMEFPIFNLQKSVSLK